MTMCSNTALYKYLGHDIAPLLLNFSKAGHGEVRVVATLSYVKSFTIRQI